LWLPTGDPHSYSGDPGARVWPHILLAGELQNLVYSGSLGVMSRPTGGFGDWLWHLSAAWHYQSANWSRPNPSELA
jgi:hypothetical protein